MTKTSSFIDCEELKENWEKKGFSFCIFVAPPKSSLKCFHNWDEIVMIHSGNVEMKMGGNKFIPKIGEEIIIPANTRYTLINVGEEIAEWYYGCCLNK